MEEGFHVRLAFPAASQAYLMRKGALISKVGNQGKKCPRIHSTSVICLELSLQDSQSGGHALQTLFP